MSLWLSADFLGIKGLERDILLIENTMISAIMDIDIFNRGIIYKDEIESSQLRIDNLIKKSFDAYVNKYGIPKSGLRVSSAFMKKLRRFDPPEIIEREEEEEFCSCSSSTVSFQKDPFEKKFSFEVTSYDENDED